MDYAVSVSELGLNGQIFIGCTSDGSIILHTSVRQVIDSRTCKVRRGRVGGGERGILPCKVGWMLFVKDNELQQLWDVSEGGPALLMYTASHPFKDDGKFEI